LIDEMYLPLPSSSLVMTRKIQISNEILSRSTLASSYFITFVFRLFVVMILEARFCSFLCTNFLTYSAFSPTQLSHLLSFLTYLGLAHTYKKQIKNPCNEESSKYEILTGDRLKQERERAMQIRYSPRQSDVREIHTVREAQANWIKIHTDQRRRRTFSQYKRKDTKARRR
jgi:hypothetical protein